MRIISKLLPASKLKLVISSIGILALVLFSSMVIFEATKVNVVVTDNGMEETVKTHQNTVGELLTELDIVVGEHDALSHGLDEEIQNGMAIDYKTAKEITVTIDNTSRTYFTTKDTVEEFLEEQNFSLTDNDDISHKDADKLADGTHIDIIKAFEIIINDGGNEKKAHTTGKSVEELLKENNIKIDDNDKVEPSLNEDVTADTKITVIRVDIEEEKITDKIAFETETKQDNSLPKGEQKVVTEGKEGETARTYKVTLENGVEVNRELIDEEVTEESVNKVVAIGTKEPEANLVTLSSSSGNSDSSGKTITMTASAFTATCSGCSGYTATGINLKSNPNMKVIAVDPNVIPLGTKVWIEGYGEAIAGDTGGHIIGNRIDVHVPNKSEAYNWGVRKVKVKILD
ncbi:G5 and 3D domain-containing protein [Oceanobacillus bengalensis]|uniref:DUF348 domain-containing protein n=1 Tax=Oceanobacillus bengalensis TaxID=1435466 RepID=A0A494YUG2_9BACI|nr:G5 and 3D domain-containing protein [Oceanobacillus bengalensis]RKQ13737.1 DUF348 domain-containing protein [Oceanobacillus bengalensis]